MENADAGIGFMMDFRIVRIAVQSYIGVKKMPRYNVQHPKTKEWRCFSSIVDDWITDWMEEERYEHWRRFEYGIHCGSVYEANQMTLEEAEEIIQERKELE